MRNLSVLLLCLVCLGSACKKKVAVDAQKSNSGDLSANGSGVGKNQWQGHKDQVDPELGTLKSID